MDDERRQMQALRRQVQAKMEAIAHQDGEAWTPDHQHQLCGPIISLGYGCEGARLRIRATVEETLVMEEYLAWVTEHFVDEIAQLDELTTAMVNRIHDDDALEDELEQALQDFLEGTDDPRPRTPTT